MSGFEHLSLTSKFKLIIASTDREFHKHAFTFQKVMLLESSVPIQPFFCKLDAFIFDRV